MFILSHPRTPDVFFLEVFSNFMWEIHSERSTFPIEGRLRLDKLTSFFCFNITSIQFYMLLGPKLEPMTFGMAATKN